MKKRAGIIMIINVIVINGLILAALAVLIVTNEFEVIKSATQAAYNKQAYLEF